MGTRCPISQVISESPQRFLLNQRLRSRVTMRTGAAARATDFGQTVRVHVSRQCQQVPVLHHVHGGASQLHLPGHTGTWILRE